ncbi:MAG TPA: GDSL-type esterase/lipase family protein [Polyangiaceae bacterium]|nr:GDSL-type esterase/lipase family protein [Polyangiaceae bacterium]
MLRPSSSSTRSTSLLSWLFAVGAGSVACSGGTAPHDAGQAGAAATQSDSNGGNAGAPGVTGGTTSTVGQATAGAAPVAGSTSTAGSAGEPGTARGGASGAGTGSGGSGGGAGGSVTGGDAEAPLDAALLSKCTGTNPIVCTIPVPANGNYTVTVELGGAAASRSRVQAEEHRISVPPTALGAGQYSRHTFSLNVREEKHDGYGAPEKILNLLIDDGGDTDDATVPALHGLGFVAAPNLPTIFVAGDSTVCDWEPTYAATKAGPLERGWAQEFSQFLKPSIAVANYADSGETASGFYGKFWPPAKALLREGDFVFIEFGHNDQGDFTAEQFKTNMKKYVTDALAAKATPVLLTPVARKSASVANPGFAGLDQATRDLAAAEKVALIDLTNMTLTYYSSAGVNKAQLFATTSEGTHFGEYGATQVSKLVADYLKTTTLPLKTHVR